MNGKYYAVKEGRTPGIYTSWEKCKAQVQGYSGARFKSFYTKEEAEAYIQSNNQRDQNESALFGGQDISQLPVGTAFVDGSFNSCTGVYGYGGFVIGEDGVHYIQGSGADPGMASMRNVAGEISGATASVREAIRLGLKQITIYYDYSGIECWVTGDWKCNKEYTAAYAGKMNALKEQIEIRFHKVKGHSNVPGNEKADELAKEAAGIR